jgi:hypothetical protein
MNRTISVDNMNLVFPANWIAGDTSNQGEFTVSIDGKSKGGGFRYETSNDDWFNIILTDNTFTVTVKENFDIIERNGYIIIHHNKMIGDDGEVVVNIKQNGVECDIQTNPSEITFTSLNFEKDEKSINISVIGGNEKYFIKSFKEYKPVEVINDEGTSTVNKVIQNDRGIKIEKIGKDKLKISSYGRVFKENGQFYEIVLAHDNDVSKTATIKVTYDDVTINDDVPSLNADDNRSEVINTEPTRTMLRKGANSLTTKNENTDNMGSYLKVYGLNEPIVELTKRSRKKSVEEPSDEIIFEHDGGVKEYDFEVSPKHAYVTVKLNCDFVKYKITNNKLILEASPSTAIYDRYGFIRIRNASDPFAVVYKRIVQKGESPK